MNSYLYCMLEQLKNPSVGVDEGDWFHNRDNVSENLSEASAKYLESLLLFYDDTYYIKYDADLREIWNTMLDLAKK